MAASDSASFVAGPDTGAESGKTNGLTLTVRAAGWMTLGALVAFLTNNVLNNWFGWPGAGAVFGDASAQAWIQFLFYPAAWAAMIALVMSTRSRDLRTDSVIISDINALLIRMMFFIVLYVGLVDAVISFLRVEGLLPAIFGDTMATNLGISSFRGVYFHMPALVLGVMSAFLTRTLGFQWLALLAVAAELLIVISRFVFSYEQAFMADLVRFWYAALFLFASAHTLLAEGHVRVDVLYSAFSTRAKGRSNTIGSVLLGISLCWVVLLIGMDGKSAIINSPLLAFETTQTGFGMYVKYLMAGYLAVFAISMMIQFVSYTLDAVADWRGDPGGHDHDVHAVQ